MNNKPFTTAVILAVSILTMNFRCSTKDMPPRPFQQSFEIPVDIYPLKKTYSLNDTFWIETEIQDKILFDTKSGQSIIADTGAITFSAVFNRFGTDELNPPNGFCEIYSDNGITVNRLLANWGTGGTISFYGCGQPGYRIRMGFKPLIRGTYWLVLSNPISFESCQGKIVPYNATTSYRYKNLDLGLDIFNSLSKNDKGGNSGIKFYTEKIHAREIFVFRVQ